MKLVPAALVLAFGLAACSSGGSTQQPSDGPSRSPPPVTCERAMELASLDLTENVKVLDQTIEACDTYADWVAAWARYPNDLWRWGDPIEVARDRCRDADDLAKEPLCGEVGETLACVPGFICSAALVPGEYTSTSTGAIVTFTLVGEGWSGLEDTPGDIRGDGFALFNDAVGGRHGIGIYAYAGEVFTQVCSPASTAIAAMDFITFLASVDGVQAEDPLPTQVGGRPAIRLDLTTDSPCNDPTFGDRMWLWPLPVHVDFHLDDGERVRVYAVDAACVTVAIVIEAFPGSNYDVLLEKAEEVIATMTIAPAC